MRRFFRALAVLAAAFAFVSCEESDEGDSVSLSSVSVSAGLESVYYCMGDEFNSSGLVATASYSDGSQKDVSGLVEISGFDSSEKKESLPVTVSYTDGGVSRAATLYVTVTDYPVAKSRVVTVSFQYFRRESEFDFSEDAYKPYTYSDEFGDDINGTVVFRINGKGMAYEATNLINAFMYYPDNSKDGVPYCSTHWWNIKDTKYISNTDVTTVSLSDLWACDALCVPYSYLYTYLASSLIPYTYGTNKKFSPDPIDDVAGKARTLLFEDIMLWGGAGGDFQGTKYPVYERDDKGNITKGTVMKWVNPFWWCMLTVETEVQDVHIGFPPSLTELDRQN